MNVPVNALERTERLCGEVMEVKEPVQRVAWIHSDRKVL